VGYSDGACQCLSSCPVGTLSKQSCLFGSGSEQNCCTENTSRVRMRTGTPHMQGLTLRRLLHTSTVQQVPCSPSLHSLGQPAVRTTTRRTPRTSAVQLAFPGRSQISEMYFPPTISLLWIKRAQLRSLWILSISKHPLSTTHRTPWQTRQFSILLVPGRRRQGRQAHL
jgi:hypothetical protein